MSEPTPLERAEILIESCVAANDALAAVLRDLLNQVRNYLELNAAVTNAEGVLRENAIPDWSNFDSAYLQGVKWYLPIGVVERNRPDEVEHGRVTELLANLKRELEYPK